MVGGVTPKRNQYVFAKRVAHRNMHMSRLLVISFATSPILLIGTRGFNLHDRYTSTGISDHLSNGSERDLNYFPLQDLMACHRSLIFSDFMSPARLVCRAVFRFSHSNYAGRSTQHLLLSRRYPYQVAQRCHPLRGGTEF